MRPEDMPEPPDGTRVVVVRRVGASNDDTLYRRDDAWAERSEYEDLRWFREDGSSDCWGDIAYDALAVYLVREEPVAQREDCVRR